MNPEIKRNENAQSRSRRVRDTRFVNYEEAPPHYRAELHAAYAAADTEAEGSAVYGEWLLVDGYEHLDCYLAHIAGTTTSAVHVSVQCASFANEAAGFDLYADEVGDGVLVRKVYDFTTAVDASIAFKVPRVGRYMRFKVWTDGGDRSGSRAVLECARVMESL